MTRCSGAEHIEQRDGDFIASLCQRSPTHEKQHAQRKQFEYRRSFYVAKRGSNRGTDRSSRQSLAGGQGRHRTRAHPLAANHNPDGAAHTVKPRHDPAARQRRASGAPVMVRATCCNILHHVTICEHAYKKVLQKLCGKSQQVLFVRAMSDQPNTKQKRTRSDSDCQLIGLFYRIRAKPEPGQKLGTMRAGPGSLSWARKYIKRWLTYHEAKQVVITKVHVFKVNTTRRILVDACKALAERNGVAYYAPHHMTEIDLCKAFSSYNSVQTLSNTAALGSAYFRNLMTEAERNGQEYSKKELETAVWFHNKVLALCAEHLEKMAIKKAEEVQQ